MPSLIYDVAVSIDGYISGPDGDISGFPAEGPHVAAYLKRLEGYSAVVMGRKTYEFGYDYGLSPGAKAYPHMEHLILSTSLELPEGSAVQVARKGWLAAVDDLMARHGSVYLCGGGLLAGFLLANNRITDLRLKRAPVVLGRGVPLFAGGASAKAELLSVKPYETGVSLESYRIKP